MATELARNLGLPPWPSDDKLKVYTGGCHCKKFRFKFTHPVIEDGAYPVITCTCSFCKAHGKMTAYAPEDKFEFTSGSFKEFNEYQFHKKVVTHHICPTCGVPLLVTGLGGAVIINVPNIDGVDLSKLEIKQFDGANLL